MTKLFNLFATLLLVSSVLAQNGSDSPSNGKEGDKPAGGSSNKDIEAACSAPECFEGKKLSYYIAYSPECTKDHHTEEVCLGSDAWCGHGNRPELYGSKQKCLELRPTPQRKAPWQPGGKAGCTDETEACRGTEVVCSILLNEILVAQYIEFDIDNFKKLCLEQRSKQGNSPPKEDNSPPKESNNPPKQPDKPFFQLPNSESCSKLGADEEPCLGTIEWCDKHGQHQGLGDKYACLLSRGFDLKAFEETFQKRLIAPVKDGILTWAQNVTKNAAIREILLNATTETTQRAITTDLSGFMDKVKGSLQRQTLEGVRKGLETYAGQKLF
ncbi:hypothetical protein X797_012044 [Metarhizium robertsii]|uniref:Uncharacterized protein n=2 Tax=Metarhizium robertsii TaxID=568076 RepID=E9EJX3_METRA|nr:uncharacterized protein MAA_01378 [Metarhizium robertsii ARSEF 23]EFZ04304.2 hypothetical protein MAA_01378 [Metarhizium robertsii ARSEF 23]EXU94870.1 hypothetical protein X797_012044 [Metarhizium robertsii]